MSDHVTDFVLIGAKLMEASQSPMSLEELTNAYAYAEDIAAGIKARLEWEHKKLARVESENK